jgi:hypothetical protein
MCLARIRLSVGVVVRRNTRNRLSPYPPRYGEAPPPRCLVAASSAATRRRSSPKRQHSPAPFLYVVLPLCEVSPSVRVGAVVARRPQLLCPVAVGSRSIGADPLPGKQRSSLLLRQLDTPPRCLLMEFLCPSDRAVSKDTCDGGGDEISPPIAPPPPQRPPLSLLHDRAGPGSQEFPALTMRRWGGFL